MTAPVMHLAELDEALAHLQEHGESNHAFGWTYLKDAQLWKTHACAQVAAE